MNFSLSPISKVFVNFKRNDSSETAGFKYSFNYLIISTISRADKLLVLLITGTWRTNVPQIFTLFVISRERFVEFQQLLRHLSCNQFWPSIDGTIIVFTPLWALSFAFRSDGALNMRFERHHTKNARSHLRTGWHAEWVGRFFFFDLSIPISNCSWTSRSTSLFGTMEFFVLLTFSDCLFAELFCNQIHNHQVYIVVF